MNNVFIATNVDECVNTIKSIRKIIIRAIIFGHLFDSENIVPFHRHRRRCRPRTCTIYMKGREKLFGDGFSDANRIENGGMARIC